MSSKNSIAGKLIELKTLYDNCIQAEKDLNHNVFMILRSKYPWYFKEEYKTHGYYIKMLLNGDHKHFSYVPMKFNNNETLEEQGQQILDAISSDPQTLINIGMGAVMAALQKNISKNPGFAYGNVDEMQRFEGLYRMLKNNFPGATITDTSPKDFGSSVRYDMTVSFPLDFNNLDAGHFKINIENKLGIGTNAFDSKFHFGTITNKSFTGGSNTYQQLLKDIQKISENYFLSAQSFKQTEEQIRQAKNRFMRRLIILYIRWRLKNNWPVFTSSIEGHVVLCSEILKAMIDDDMLHLISDSMVGDNLYTYYRSHKYKQMNIEYDSRTKQYQETEIYKHDPQQYGSYGSNEYAKQHIQNFPKQVRKILDYTPKKIISPNFAAHLWYGKQ